MNKAGVMFFAVLFLASCVQASYISGDVYISENGEARFSASSDVNPDIKGISFENNKISGITSMMTVKRAEVWAFSLNLGSYDSILLDVHLPKNLDYISSISGVESVIDIDNRMISLIDSNKNLEFEVEYTLKRNSDYFWISYLIITVLAVLVLYLFIKVVKRKKGKEKMDYILPIINDNEKKIVELLMKRPARQKEVRKFLDIPKASFSRYIINLERKKLITREGEGKNKILRLK